MRIEMQANITNRGNSKMHDGAMEWHLFTDAENQFVEAIDVFPPARVLEREEKNMVAMVKIPELNPGESFSPSVILRIDTTTRDWLMEPRLTPDQELSQNRELFCTTQKYWEINDDLVQEMTQMAAGWTGDDESYARIVFDMVRQNVKLKAYYHDRRGAARAARDREGDCDEHADLFIALCRAVNIPARRVVGHFFRNRNNPEPHAWCEVLLENRGWIPTDPALGHFGVLNENYFWRIREGLVSERPTIQLKWSGVASEPPTVEENVIMNIVSNNHH